MKLDVVVARLIGIVQLTSFQITVEQISVLFSGIGTLTMDPFKMVQDGQIVEVEAGEEEVSTVVAGEAQPKLTS